LLLLPSGSVLPSSCPVDGTLSPAAMSVAMREGRDGGFSTLYFSYT
jgi:hypothetical protein